MPNNEPSSRITRATGAALAGLLLVPATAIAAVALVGVTSGVPENEAFDEATSTTTEQDEVSVTSTTIDDHDDDGSTTSTTIDDHDDDGSTTSTTIDDDDGEFDHVHHDR